MKEEERDRLLDILKSAPDEVLINAVLEMKATRQRLKEDLDLAFKYFGNGKPKDSVPPVIMVSKVEQNIQNSISTSSNNIKPPGDAAARIGSETENLVTRYLKDGPKDVDKLALVLARPIKLTESLLARLWDKKVVKYDGEKYYI